MAAAEGPISTGPAATAPAASAQGRGLALIPCLHWLPWLMLLPLLLSLGSVPLFDVDEGAFSEATREMLVSGDYGHTTLNGAPRFDKPILVYWLQAISVSVWGVGPFAFRLPSALCVWLMGLAVLHFARPRFGPTAATLAAMALVCSTGMFVMARAATADALLNLLLTLAGLDLWRHLESGRRAPLRRAALWIGLGLLTKGPVALLVPGAAVLLWCLLGRQWDALRRSLSDPLAWAILVAVALPWYAYALDRHGLAFVDGFIMRHNVERFSGTLQGHHGSLAYYLLMLPLLCLPWSSFIWPVLRNARQRWADPLTRFLCCWVGFVLVFFSLSGTKLPHYALYGLCPLALLIGQAAAQDTLARRRAFWAACLVWLGLLVLAPVWIQAHPGQISSPLYRNLLSGLPVPWSLLAAGAVALLVIGALAVTDGPFSLRAGLAAACGAVLIAGWVAPWWGEALQGPIQRAAWFARALSPSTVVQWGVHWPSAAVTLEAPMPLRDPVGCELALVRLDRLDPTRADRVLFAERGVGIVRVAGPACVD